LESIGMSESVMGVMGLDWEEGVGCAWR
jgi:hypothetical protein